MIAFDEIAAYATTNSNDAIRKDAIKQWMSKAMPLLEAGARKGLIKAIDDMKDALSKAEQHMKEHKYGKADFSFNIPRKDVEAAISSLLHTANLQLADHTAITGRAFLIAAESSFEVLFGQLARVIYAKNPAALPRTDHAFTLEEISSYDSIEDARDALIVRKIESLLRESPDEWAKWLKRTVGISMDQIMPDWPQVREIFTRRNMLVHTEGKITDRYLAEIKRTGGNTDGLEIGQSLIPSPSYLRNALQRLIAFETLLVCKVISHIDKQEADGLAKWLAGKIEQVTRKEMWQAVCLIADGSEGIQGRRETQLKILVGGWLAHKNRDGISHIRAQVSAWDVSGLSKEYGAIKKVLLDQLSAEDLLALIEAGIFTQFEVFDNPLFAGILNSIPTRD